MNPTQDQIAQAAKVGMSIDNYMKFGYQTPVAPIPGVAGSGSAGTPASLTTNLSNQAPNNVYTQAGGAGAPQSASTPFPTGSEMPTLASLGGSTASPTAQSTSFGPSNMPSGTQGGFQNNGIGAPVAPTQPTLPSGTPNLPTPTLANTADQYLQNYLKTLSPTQTESDLQSQQAALTSANQQGQFNVSQQPIATPFITGQSAAIQKQNDLSQQTLTGKLALEQSKRQSSIDVSKAALDYASNKDTQANQLAQRQYELQFQAQQQQLQNAYASAQEQYKLQFGQYSQDLQNQFTQRQQALQNQFTSQQNQASSAADLAKQQQQNAFTASQNTQSQQATASNNNADNQAALARQQLVNQANAASDASKNQYITVPSGSELINTQGSQSSKTPTAQQLIDAYKANGGALSSAQISQLYGATPSSQVVASNPKPVTPTSSSSTAKPTSLAKGSLSSAAYVEKVMNASGKSYDTVVKTLQTQYPNMVPVIKNATGEIGAITPAEMNTAIYTKL